jgi:hypothetical protein
MEDGGTALARRAQGSSRDSMDERGLRRHGLPACEDHPACQCRRRQQRRSLKVKVDALVCDDKSCMPFKQEVALTLRIASTLEANTEQAAFLQAASLEKKTPETPPAKAASGEVRSARQCLRPFSRNCMLYAFMGGLILNIMPCVSSRCSASRSPASCSRREKTASKSCCTASMYTRGHPAHRSGCWAASPSRWQGLGLRSFSPPASISSWPRSSSSLR